MTDFTKEKDKIWEAARSSDKTAFDSACEALMVKVANDWWRLGWNLAPKNANEVVSMIDNLAKSAHEAWIAAVKCGDAPAEDISPSEGFALCSKLIKDELQRLEEMRNEV